MLRLEITRYKTSYNYKYRKSSPSGYDNNGANNMQDIFVLKDEDDEIFVCTCQSVQNLDWGDHKSNGPKPYGDTIAPGHFDVRLFANPRNYHGSVHEIFYAQDMDGHDIDKNAMQCVNGKWSGRWLIHDKWSNKACKESSKAWSAGCIILSCRNLEAFNKVVQTYGLKKDDVIKGFIREV